MEVSTPPETMAHRATSGPVDEQLWKHSRQIRDAARRVLWDAAASEDVAQEALLRALCNVATIDKVRQGAWLTVVGRRLAIDESRLQQRVACRAEPVDRAAVDEDPAVIVEHRELLAQVWDAIGRLSPREQRLLLGQVASGLSLDQLATEERTTVASVRSALTRARDAVRASLHQTGWLVAGSANRMLNEVQDSVNRLLTHLEQAAPRIPQLSRNTSDALTAAAAAVALLFATPSAAPDRPASAEQPSSVVEGVAASVDPSRIASLDNLRLSPLSEKQLLDNLSRASAAVEDDDRYQVIPFSETDGEIVQFAVAPDQQTVLASGGWAETAESAEREQLVKEWEPTLYRSDDGGQHWKRVRAPGFVPGRVLFAPAWPIDLRIFVATRNGIIVSNDGGRTYQRLQSVDANNPGPSSLNAAQEATEEDPKTTIRSEQRPPSDTPLRPAVFSPRFSVGDERIYVGDPAEVIDVRTRVAEPLVSVPPWTRSRGIATASDYASSDAVLVGATESGVGSSGRGALFRCAERKCDKLHVFDDISEAPGVFASPNDPNLVYVWTTYVAYRSVDGGITWQRQVLGPVVDLTEVGNRLVFLSLSGVPVSDDRGGTWRELRVLYSISAVAPIGRDGLLLAAGPGMACSPDRGDHWRSACI